MNGRRHRSFASLPHNNQMQRTGIDSVGIAVATVPPTPKPFRLDPNQPGVRIPVEPDATMTFGIGSLRGVLMAEQNGMWHRIVIELPPAQTLPLEH
jgi:hypothetical protein